MGKQADHPEISMFEAAGHWVLAYVAALAAAVGMGCILGPIHPLLIVASADLAATVVVFLFSVALNNSSVYDPYWSAAPIVIASFLALAPSPVETSFTREVVVVVLVSLWGVRLTYNWARQWKGAEHEDWRYVDIRNRTGRAYWPASFLSIHLFPTVIVYLGCLSLYPALAAGGAAFGFLDIIAAVLTAAAIWIEAASDKQLHKFAAGGRNRDEILDKGLWAFSRHPNYFGEILFWWGLFVFAIASDPSYWWTIIGPLSITALFVFISVPMMERRMLGKRPKFAQRKKKVSMIIPWFRR